MPGAAGKSLTDMFQGGLVRVRQQLNAPEFASFFLGDRKKVRDGLIAAHHKGKAR